MQGGSYRLLSPSKTLVQVNDQASKCRTAQAAQAEVEAGATGSKALRAAALWALRLLVGAVADGDALAFFVPGIVSGLSNALLAAGAVPAVGHMHHPVTCDKTSW